MRKIQFRAWDGARMLTNAPNLMIDYRGVPYWQFGFDEPKIMEDTLLMQFTGFKDKYGIDIYEGDIVSYPNITMKFAVMFGQAKINIEEYKCSIVGFYLHDSSGNQTFQYSVVLKVIGNIYENPELINL